MSPIERAVVSFKHALVCMCLDDANRSGNVERAMKLAAEECRLRAELEPLGTTRQEIEHAS